MSKKMSLLFMLFLLPAWGRLFPATKSPSPLSILSAEEFIQRREPTWSILDCRSSKKFREGRIPGSQNINWEQWTEAPFPSWRKWLTSPKRWGLIRRSDEKLQQTLRERGLSNEKCIVVVGEPAQWGEEGRVAWDLLYWGAKDVRLLNGGYSAWEKVTKATPEKGPAAAPNRGDFHIQIQKERRAFVHDIQKSFSTNLALLVDNRSKEEFHGEKIMGQKRGGHIPGALSLPINELYNQDGTYISPTELKKLIPSENSKKIISYCAGGVRSALFAMLWEAYFGEIVANYDGSIWEWSTNQKLPLK